MNIHKKNIPKINELLENKWLFERDGYLFPYEDWKDAGMEKFQTIKNMKSSENGVIVIGMPKAGNHFMMSVLDAMGCDRAEEIGQEASGGVSAKPFECQRSLEAYRRMETKMEQSNKPIILPHCHLYADFSPDNFKGKIVFISRDQRAIIASAYPFLRQLPYFNQYFETWGFENLDEFARHDAEGKMYWGEVSEYDKSWREYVKRNPNVDIMFFKFEDFIKNKAWVRRIENVTPGWLAVDTSTVEVRPIIIL